MDELETAFHESVDHYLEVSKRTGRPAQKPYSGNLMLRINPDIHAAVASAAQVQGKSINQWASEYWTRRQIFDSVPNLRAEALFV